jgi:N-methylhydantoinase A
MEVGVEIGGTFTDLVLSDGAGVLRAVKVPSTPSAPAGGALTAMLTASEEIGSMATIVHGSTIATNGVLERRGAPLGLLTTKGFRDVVALQRQDRTDVYSLKYRKPKPLVGLEFVHEIDERVRATGEVVRPLDADNVRRALRTLQGQEVTAVAVCLLHAYEHPAHELAVREIAEREFPELAITLSHEIAPEYREYERTSTTVLSSYVQPIIDGYLGEFERSLAEHGFGGALHIMQSNGGALPASLIRRHAVRTLLSGPAGGVTAARAVAGRLGLKNIVTFDMGGTSTDVALIENGDARLAVEAHIDNLPIRVPMLDIVTVGAGGGSIARVDAGGMLRVGPESAGAEPGPACYGRGGSDATVTDANLVLGRIRADAFLGGRMQLDVDAAFTACEAAGSALGLDTEAAARAIVDVANASMLGALRSVSTERGVDPRESWLLCYGGAGGQHAVTLAEDLGVLGVILPRFPGLFSAYGLLIADIQRDWTASFLRPLAQENAHDLLAVIEELKTRAREEFVQAGQSVDRLEFTILLDLRYPGQGFELDMAVDEKRLEDIDAIIGQFHQVHRARYGHAADHERPDVVTVRVRAILPRMQHEKMQTPEPARQKGNVMERGSIVHRDDLAQSDRVRGSALIEEETTTLVVPVGWIAYMDELENIRIVREGT